MSLLIRPTSPFIHRYHTCNLILSPITIHLQLPCLANTCRFLASPFTILTPTMVRKRAATTTEITPDKSKRRMSSRLRGAAAPVPERSTPVSGWARKGQEELPISEGSEEEAKMKKPRRTTTGKPVTTEEKQPASPESDDNGDLDPDPDTLPDINLEVERHEGEWYWLMKAEPETRYESGIDVKFSIDDLRAKAKPEPWDGIRNYAARNNLKAMNYGDKAFFYHSNTKEPGIVGIMEIVKEYSEDVSARRPGTAYYDSKSTREKPIWGLVHVRFVKKFAVPISLQGLKALGTEGKLPEMQMLKQSRLSVSKVGREDFRFLCELADQKAKEAGLEHET